MYIIIIGAGNVGYGLALELYSHADYEILLVENDRGRAEMLRDELGELCVHGDGTEVTFLESIGVSRADVVIAVTGDDSHNLIACQVAQHSFGVSRTIARVNNPRNERLFQTLGIESTVSAASAVLAQIEADLPAQSFIPLLRLRASGLEVVDLHVQPRSRAADVALRDLDLPDDAVISLVVSGDQSRVPDGDTVLQAGDEIIAVIGQESEPAMRELVRSPDEPQREIDEVLQ
ncbi:MAG: TrkA family potassium uptake protein [Chloroflexi bacterium]|nr:TrkA family potassium uptake protein [Chloroflexota bacterium]MYD64419.1 TrkA family potassium uptake protein [Chloroflexota bacterium]